MADVSKVLGDDLLSLATIRGRDPADVGTLLGDDVVIDTYELVDLTWFDDVDPTQAPNSDPNGIMDADVTMDGDALVFQTTEQGTARNALSNGAFMPIAWPTAYVNDGTWGLVWEITQESDPGGYSPSVGLALVDYDGDPTVGWWTRGLGVNINGATTFQPHTVSFWGGGASGAGNADYPDDLTRNVWLPFGPAGNRATSGTQPGAFGSFRGDPYDRSTGAASTNYAHHIEYNFVEDGLWLGVFILWPTTGADSVSVKAKIRIKAIKFRW